MSKSEPVADLRRGVTLPSPPLPVAGEHWALFLDVDGTLLSFADDPREVCASASLRALLQRVHDTLDGALALVSGRTLTELDRLFNRPPWALAGLHGLELRLADGTCRRFEVAEADQQRMRVAAQTLLLRFAGVQPECKGSAVALHCRREPALFPGLLAAASAAARQLPGYEVQPGSLVVEFKPAGMDKGRAVGELLRGKPFAGRRPVYLGDDLTDEHAFAQVNGAGGLSVRVGAREPTMARHTLADPAAVEGWLRGLLDQKGVTDA